MQLPARNLLPLFLLVISVLGGCLRGGDGQPSPSTTGEPNACSPYPAPSIDRGDDDTFRGSNAFAYTIGLVCGREDGIVRERARVPGTPEHEAGAHYLAEALDANGFQSSVDNFTGNEYEALVQGKKTSRAYQYYASPNFCKPEDVQRLRGLAFANVVGKGGNLGGPIFLLMAHWDSKRFAEGTTAPVLGANDGAAGVGILLELARVVEHVETDMEIRVLFTDGEDGFEDCHPLAGSMMYADRLDAEEKARLSQGRILLLDMVGDADVAFYKGCGSDDDLADRVWAAARELDVPQFKDEAGCGVVDDHTPFEEAGLKTVDVIATPFPSYWHTTQDTPDKLDEDMMGDIGRILLRVIDGLGEGLPILS